MSSTPGRITEDEKKIAKECGFLKMGGRFSCTEDQLNKFIYRIEREAVIRERYRAAESNIHKGG